ncbi:hypothetical protein QMM35_08065 [Leptospira santarosai]|uniref:Lipoprotein n=1 Tax=Leptospira santarosai TaxID=28183 RepID=A0AB73NE09_9LEPT|nr:hypothetical protein [Leptospira santarosai]AVV50709.1 Uncharacterized protein XB17_02126 [Leptospira santarosai]AVV79058.1 Uncharacterized protein XB15_01273 [Leptospira santarosai]MDI7165172.1 hypothetical protein [Leptospira santarosai]MDI7173928.1 hypothetical protein [Leptospira santarosai]MDI7193190.1 hypothetical protein [Leptospira santarosai]
MNLGVRLKVRNLYAFLYSVRLRFGLLVPILFFLYSCTSLELNSVKGGGAKPILNSQKNSNVSGHSPSNCRSSGKKYQWYALFGSVPINNVDYSEILPDQNRTYRVILKTTWLDGILSTFLGIAASVTRKTIDVESCDSKEIISAKPVVSNESEKEVSKVDPAGIKEEFIKRNEKQWKEEFQERIHSSLREELESSWNKEVRSSKNLSVLFLKSGEIVKGTVIRIDENGIKFSHKGKERSFRRSDIQRVRFQD